MEIFIPRISTSIHIGHRLIGGTILFIGGSTGVVMTHGGAIPGTTVIITIPGTDLIMAGIIMIPTGPTGMATILIHHRKSDHLSGMTILAGSERTLPHP
jgi:hypothetical protein